MPCHDSHVMVSQADGLELHHRQVRCRVRVIVLTQSLTVSLRPTLGRLLPLALSTHMRAPPLLGSTVSRLAVLLLEKQVPRDVRRTPDALPMAHTQHDAPH